MLVQLLANGFSNGLMIALMAAGFALIYNTTRVFHVAHGAVYVLAAYTYYALSQRLLLPKPLAVGATLLVAALFGAAIESFIYAPLYRKQAPQIVSLLSSFGLYVAIVNCIAMFFGNEIQVVPAIRGAAIQFGPILIARIQIVEGAVSILTLVPLTVFLWRSEWGRLIRATRDNPQLVAAMGTDLLSIRRLVFVIGSGLAGIAAILSVVDVGADPQSGMPAFLIATVAVIVGGLGSFGGAILGSIVVAVLQSLAVWRVSPRWSDAITFAILILFMVFRPTGLIGSRRRIEEAID